MVRPGLRFLRRRASRDRGSAAAELVLITPVLILLLLFAVAAGRLVQARLEVDSAARQAARAASLARDPATAAAAAVATAQAALAGQGITCSPVSVSPDTGNFTPGGQVSVQVSCTIHLSDLALLHIPGAETLSSTFTSPIDVYRGGATQSQGPASAGESGSGP
jgi:Flp pilus assembly protein TadG